MKYKDALTAVMAELGVLDNTIFLGQGIVYPKYSMFHTLRDVPDNKKIEMPVAGELQMGISIGLALGGFMPISIYPRMDFMMCCMNQLVNHLDKIEEMSCGRYRPKVIIRTSVGSQNPLNSGSQHCRNHIATLRSALKNIPVWACKSVRGIFTNYTMARRYAGSVVLVEYEDLYEESE